MDEQRQIRIYQLVVMLASAALILMLLIAIILSGPAKEWRSVQRQMKELGFYDSDYHFKKGIHEIDVDGMDRIDRCISCHVGIENPEMKGKAQPYGFHPGDYLAQHPVEKYGCTICHGGQGRALNSKDAHALSDDVHWNYPLLQQPYIQSSCGQCHLTVFTENEQMAGTETFVRGHEIFSQEGCLGCHKARGVGGIIGPDLTEQGEKTSDEYSFRYIDVEQTVSNWLKEHFRDPEMVSPGSQMLKIDLPEEDLDALSTFVLGLTKPEIEFQYFSMETLKEFKGERIALDGTNSYSLACAACHGKEGEGKSYEDYKTGIPGIKKEDFRSVVSDEYLKFTLMKGRSKRQMASWETKISGISEKELDELIDYVLDQEAEDDVTFRKNKYVIAKEKEGKPAFAAHCASCHGEDAEGGVALALARADFIRNVENAYLYKTLKKGRGNAGMPAWAKLGEEQLYDLVKFLRSYGAYGPQTKGVSFAVSDVDAGKLSYHFNCSRCHGEAGQGQTGPALINADFLDVAEDEYLYNTIAWGHEGTAMFGWSKDVYNDERLDLEEIGNVVAFLRKEAADGQDYIYAGANPGSKETGQELYVLHCAECHGDRGEGENAPALNNQELLSAASNGYLMATMTVGRAETAMPSWGSGTEKYSKLSAKERQDIVAWLRNWERVRLKK